MKIRTIIVDDEPLARSKLRLFLEGEPDFKVVRECSNGAEAIAVLQKNHADVVFLDIQMPEVDGFAVVESVPPERLPFVVFVTAHDAFAVKAFEIHALDYLLKPFDRERLSHSLSRVREALKRASIERHHDEILSMLNDLRIQRGRPERILIRSSGRVHFVSIDEIEWAEAEGNYIRLHIGSESHLVRRTMNAFQKQLDPHRFIRIHRSTLVSIERIKELQPWFGGEYLVILHNGKRLNVSRTFRKKLTDTLAHRS